MKAQVSRLPSGATRSWRIANLLTGAVLLSYCLAGWADSAPADKSVTPHVPTAASTSIPPRSQ